MPVKTKIPYSEILDYGALQPIHDGRKIPWMVRASVPFIFVAVLLLGSSLLANVNRAAAADFRAGLEFLFFAALVVAVINFQARMKQQATVYPQFAEANGLEYDDRPGYQPIGTLFTLGHDGFTGARIKGAIDGYPYAVYWHRYTTGYGRSQVTHYYDVVEIDLPKRVPQVYIDHRDYEYVEADPIGEVLGKSNLHQLEGPFAKKYKIYFNSVYASAALTLLNPLFMEHLLSYGSKCDFEFAGNKLFVYSTENLGSSEEKFKTLLNTAEFMVDELQRQFDTFTFEPKEGDGGSMYTKSKVGEAEAQFGW